MKHRFVIGIDEVGRGPLAGPITLAALALPKKFRFMNAEFLIKDSKKLKKEQREEVFRKLKELKKEGKICYSVSYCKHFSIDKYGISTCVSRGISRCLKKLKILPNQAKILLDGSLKAPAEYENQKTIIKGDEKVKIIALASIIAKVSRDRHMRRLAKKFPKYGFEIHKGYGTKLHRDMIKKHGPCEIHRKTFGQLP